MHKKVQAKGFKIFLLIKTGSDINNIMLWLKLYKHFIKFAGKYSKEIISEEFLVYLSQMNLNFIFLF